VTLRSRLVLVLLLTAFPLVAGLVWLRAEMERDAEIRALYELTRYRIEFIGRARCEAAPELIGGPFGHGGPSPIARSDDSRAEERGRLVGAHPPWGRSGNPGHWRAGPGAGAWRAGHRSMRMFVYDAAFQSASPEAPPLSDALRDELAGGADWAGATERDAGTESHIIALRTGWEAGPCAYVLMRGYSTGDLRRETGFISSAVALSVGLVAAVWIAVGPVIRRIRRLVRAMRRSAASQYEQPVPVEGRDEVTDLARAFNAAGMEARTHLMEVARREETLRSFLGSTTHDLAIPLSVLQGHLSAMRRAADAGAFVKPEQIAAAAEEASHLGALVHNLGAAAKLEAGEGIIRRDALDLGALVERVIERHRPLAGSRGIELVSAVPPDATVHIDGDLTLLEQAVGNLVANAVRYNDADGHVAVILEMLRAEPPFFRLRIVDDGPGVSAEELPRLGERRFRGQAGRARHADGQGLGLHIAREVASRHGFTLVFASATTGGLQATIEGPVSLVAD
jgi:signal transduction histidine kinase